MEYPSVSIVILNYNGILHLKECLPSIYDLHYPKDKIEVVVVDNGSSDGSVEYLEKTYPEIKIQRNSRNEGFAKPSNDGARIAAGEYVAFLNNDIKVRPDWLSELVKSLYSNQAKCAGSVILDWSGRLLDFAGGSISFYGMGYQHNFHKKLRNYEKDLNSDRELFFACGGAMIIDRQLFLSVGGFDEDFFAYFEDVDLGWRLNIMGYKVVLSVRSRALHRHHGTSTRFVQDNMKLLYERNSLYTIYKNYGEEYLNRAFWPSLLMQNAMILKNADLRRSDYDINAAAEPGGEGPRISNLAAAELCALDDFIRNLNKMSGKRNFVQAHRRISDKELSKFFPEPFYCLWKDRDVYGSLKYDFNQIFGIDRLFGIELKRKILIVAGESAAYEERKVIEAAAASLQAEYEVTLALYKGQKPESDSFRILRYDTENNLELKKEAAESSVIIIDLPALTMSHNFLSAISDKYLVVVFGHSDEIRPEDYQTAVEAGDYFLIDTQAQLDRLAELGGRAKWALSHSLLTENKDNLKKLHDYCENPVHNMERFYFRKAVSAGESAPGRNAGVLPRINLIEQRLERTERLQEETIENIKKMNEWMETMNDRYLRGKNFLGRFKFMRRFLNN